MKKLLSVILTLAMILSLATVLTVTSSAAAWNGTDVSSALSGEGAEANPYKITSGADFAYIRDQVNGGETFAGKYFSIENDIDFGNNSWYPIGTTSAIVFSGIIEGNNKTLSGYVAEPTSDTENILIGFFGSIKDATIKNIKIVNATSNAGKNAVCGGFIGKVDSSVIENIETGEGVKVNNLVKNSPQVGGVFGSVTGSTLTNIVSNTQIYAEIEAGKNCFIGGVVGVLGGGTVLKNAVNFGKVESKCSAGVIQAGGIAGGLGMSAGVGTIENVVNYGSVSSLQYAAGIVGRINAKAGSTMKNVYNLSADITVAEPSDTSAAGSAIGYALYGVNVENAYSVPGFATTVGKIKEGAEAGTAESYITKTAAEIEALPEVEAILIATGLKTPEPAADSTLTIADAVALAATKDHNVYTAGKYYVSGVIDEIVSTKYGNMYIKDAEGNRLYIYGTYTADGVTRYDAMNPQPQVGDTVTVYGVLGQYNSSIQMKSGWVTKLEQVAPEVPPVNPDEPDEPIVEPETPATSSTTISPADFGLANATDFSQYTSGDVTISAAKGGDETNGPKYYDSGTSLRIYTGNVFTIAVPEGKTIEKIVFTTVGGKDWNTDCTANGATVEVDGTTVTATVGNGVNSITFTNAGTQIRFGAIEVVYSEPVVTPPDAPQTGDSLGTAIVIAACALAIGTAAAVVLARKKENA